MDKRIESYLDSVIPEKLSKRRQKLIREELRDHISDHIEFYTEIGYSEDESIQKALADMGDDGGVTAMVKKDFEKVYGEKIWMPILAFVLTTLVIMSAMFGGVWIVSGDSKGSPQAYEVFLSFAIILVMSFALAVAYRKGFKKTLLAIGIPNLLFGATLISSGYSQPAIYALISDIGFLLEKTTPLITYKFASEQELVNEYISFIAGIVLDIGLALVSLILFIKLRKKGTPEKKSKKGIIIMASVLCAAAIGLTFMYTGTEEFYRSYKYVMNGKKFETSDGICKQSEAAFESIDLGMDYNEAVRRLRVQGYMPFDEYRKTQSREMSKRLKYSLGELELTVTDEGYTVFINPNIFYDDNDIYGRNGSNGFVYLRADSDGCVESKGVGSGAAVKDKYGYVPDHHSGGSGGRDCYHNYKTVRAGDSRDEVMKKLAGEDGDIFARFLTLKNGEENEYCRVSHAGSGEPDEIYYPVVAELWFENGKLSDAKLYCLSEYVYNETRVYELQK